MYIYAKKQLKDKSRMSAILLKLPLCPFQTVPSMSAAPKMISLCFVLIIVLLLHSFTTTDVFISKYLLYLCLDFVKMHHILNCSVTFPTSTPFLRFSY